MPTPETKQHSFKQTVSILLKILCTCSNFKFMRFTLYIQISTFQFITIFYPLKTVDRLSKGYASKEFLPENAISYNIRINPVNGSAIFLSRYLVLAGVN